MTLPPQFATYLQIVIVVEKDFVKKFCVIATKSVFKKPYRSKRLGKNG